MNYLSCTEAARCMGVSERRVQQMCKRGEISGVIKEGRSWRIPELAASEDAHEKKKPLPIGISDYRDAAQNYYYVDKTLLIRDFLDAKPMVSLFTRPRRFGKTLNMDMLRVFFEKTGEDTSVYFRNREIWACGENYTRHQGQYPVIFLSFKDVKCLSWEETFQKLRKLISLECMRHGELEHSTRLSSYEREQFHRLADDDASEVNCEMGLQLLSLLLHKHYGEKCVIIIDEYDTPIQQGHSCNFYPEIVQFMRNFFSGGLKDNPHLAFGFLTGILRVAKESIFSGMNNLKTYSILDDRFSAYFGFTGAEVKDMLRYYGYEEKYAEICEWYDGYRFGDTEIFNPWSVLNYISDQCFPKAFWQSTGSNDIIGEIIGHATPEVTESLYRLLTGDSITTYVDTSVIYPEVQRNPYSIFSFLLVAGYLKVDSVYPQNDGNYMCEVAIPNKEIRYVYEKEVLNRTDQNSTAISISQAVFMGNAEIGEESDSMERLKFRVAHPEDAEALLKIYAPYVKETAITFEYEVPSIEEFRARIRNTLETYPYIVAVMENETEDEHQGCTAGTAALHQTDGGVHAQERIVGYAYVGRLHARAAYDWSVETSIYVDRSVRKMGVGRKLYERLEAILRAMHIINVNACIAYPCKMADNSMDPHLDTNSPDFHAHLGYQLVGHFHACAYKFDRWYDMIWMEKWIAPHPAKPEPMIPFPKLPEEVVEQILKHHEVWRNKQSNE